MLVCQLCSCHPHRGLVGPWNIQTCPNGRGSCSPGGHVGTEVSTTGPRFYVVSKEVLQACMGLILFGIWSIHANLKCILLARVYSCFWEGDVLLGFVTFILATGFECSYIGINFPVFITLFTDSLDPSSGYEYNNCS